MADPIDSLSATSADWRKSLNTNNRKTFMVISVFFLIYIALGLLVDTYITAGRYPNATIPQLLEALVTFQLFPLATLVMIGVAGVSLFVTFSMSDKLMLLGTEYHEVTPNTAQSTAETMLYNVIEEMKIAASLSFMPKVYIIDADYMNAFASGYSEKSAMVAITRGLMQKLNRSELQAVMAHELSHIRHMDIKLTLMASVLANLMLMILDIFFYNAIFSNRSSDSRSRSSLLPIIMIIRYLLPVINVLLLLYLSRTREYMADAGSVQLLRDNQPLASALLKIENDHVDNKDAYSQAYQQTPHENVRREAYIFDPVQAGIEAQSSLADVFSTHPSIKDRLAAIGFKFKQ
ncbi:MAG: zinc metalloprotease HtpX [Gammaproteobacteria bacterium]|nr:zinc metalloprotease HtpX [Gammaproteobacteria bacterium]